MRTVNDALRWVAELGDRARLYDPRGTSTATLRARTLLLALSLDELKQPAMLVWDTRQVPAGTVIVPGELGRVYVRLPDGRLMLRWVVVESAPDV